MESDENIYLPAVTVYNIAAEDSYQSIKDDVVNTLTLLGIGGSVRVLTLANSARMMRLVAVVDVIKVGILDNVFNDPEFRDYIINEIDGPTQPVDGLAKDFFENVWPILSTATDIAALAVSAPTIFAKVGNTGDDIADVLDDITSPTNNSFNATKKQLAADGRDALRQVTKVAKLIDALKAAYPALANYSRLSELVALPNAEKLLGSGISDAIKALSTNQKQLDLFDDLIDNVTSNVYNGNLIDDFVAKPAFAQAWEKLSGFSTAIRLGKTSLNQRRILDEWLPNIATASNKRKGNLGEMTADLDLNTKGYTSKIARIDDIDAPGHNGIDGVFEKNGEYFIVEGKYGSASIQQANPTTGLDRQMSNDWIELRIDDAVGSAVLGQQIFNSPFKRILAKVKSDGSVSYKLIGSDGYLNGGGGAWTP